MHFFLAQMADRDDPNWRTLITFTPPSSHPYKTRGYTSICKAWPAGSRLSFTDKFKPFILLRNKTHYIKKVNSASEKKDRFQTWILHKFMHNISSQSLILMKHFYTIQDLEDLMYLWIAFYKNCFILSFTSGRHAQSMLSPMITHRFVQEGARRPVVRSVLLGCPFCPFLGVWLGLAT